VEKNACTEFVHEGELTTSESEIEKGDPVNILRFQPNVPTQVALQSSQGIVVEGRYGNRMMFSLVDGRVMYVPPIVATKIEAEGIAAGERFELCKAQIKNGHGRPVEWALRRLDPEEQLVEVAPDTPAPESQLEHDLRVSVETANAKKASSELPEPPPPAPAPAIPTTEMAMEPERIRFRPPRLR
jgi:hypothetical protein